MTDLIIPDWPAPPRVHALITTRAGGVSSGPFASFNVADHVGDDPEAVAENRRRLGARLPAEPSWLVQVHGSRAVRTDEVTPGTAADAAWTTQSALPCAVLTADCLPVLLCDESGSVVAAAHAGWRGLAAGVVEAAICAMGRPAPALMAYLGPAIGPAAFQVGDEVRQAFVAQHREAGQAFTPDEAGKWRADLYALARARLTAAGVTQIFGGGFCTVTEERFFSYRRDGVTGRMAAVVWLD